MLIQTRGEFRHTRAFIVLSHAEIESYLEAWAKEITRSCKSACKSAWKGANRVTKPLAFLLVSISERIEAGQTLAETKGKDMPTRLEESAKRMFQKHYKQVKDNHGIKEKNFWSLFGPLGVPATALPSTLLPNLDSLGDIRGRHAHQSTKAVASILDPETEYKRVSSLVDELKTFDGWIAKYKHAIR